MATLVKVGMTARPKPMSLAYFKESKYLVPKDFTHLKFMRNLVDQVDEGGGLGDPTDKVSKAFR